MSSARPSRRACCARRASAFTCSGSLALSFSDKDRWAVRRRSKRVIEGPVGEAGGYVVLDFGQVPGLDTSAVLSLVSSATIARGTTSRSEFSGLTEAMQLSFEKAGFLRSTRRTRCSEPQAQAVDMVEEQLLLMHHEVARPRPCFESCFQPSSAARSIYDRIVSYMERSELEVGEFLFGRASRRFHCASMASGCVAIAITPDGHGSPDQAEAHDRADDCGRDGISIAVATHGHVIAEGPTVVLPLTREAFEGCRRKSHCRGAFHKLISCPSLRPSRIRQSRDSGCCSACRLRGCWP